jgi:hypothetical protein
MGTFTREELNNRGQSAAEEIEEEAAADEVVEADDDGALSAAMEAADKAIREGAPTRTRPTAEQAEAVQRAAVESALEVDDEEIPDLGVEMPMPDMSDPDVDYDNERLRAKTTKWVDSVINRKITVTKLRADVESKVAEFAKIHPDFATVVTNNTELAKYQLHPIAGAAAAASKDVGAMLYAFGKDIAYAKRVASLPLPQQLIEIGKLKARVAAQGRPAAAATVSRTDKGDGQRPTITRKAPLSREEQLSGKSSMAEIARQSRAKKQNSRFYAGKK